MRVILLAAALLAPAAFADFEPEPLGQVATVPTPYPAGWLVVHDLAFNHMREGRFYLIDPDADTLSGQMRGIMSGDLSPASLPAPVGTSTTS